MKRRLNWTLTEEEAERLHRESDTRSTRTMEHDDIRIVYQPIVDTSSGRVAAVEALVRPQWEEFKGPEHLIDTAVREGAMGRLGRLIRDVAIQGAPGTPIFVNVHPVELSSRWLVRPDDPINFYEHQVYIEITEAAAFEYFDLCMGVLKEVCSRSRAKLVLDDFGAGFSNLRRLMEISPDVVKLDRALITDLDTNVRQRRMVQHAVAMCHDLGAWVIAEGVETKGELRAAVHVGADFIQGYLLARPGNPMPRASWPPDVPLRPRPKKDT